MRTVKPFRLKAARCRILAAKATAPDLRARYLEIARKWERLSDDCDRAEIASGNAEHSSLRQQP